MENIEENVCTYVRTIAVGSSSLIVVRCDYSALEANNLELIDGI